MGLCWPVPLGFGRRMIKSAIEAMTMQVMTMSRSGLQKAGLLSGGGVGEDAMVVGCRMREDVIFS